MKKPSVKWLAVAATGCIFASSMGTYTYKALADEFVYTDANVSITSIVDRYIEEQGGEVFTAQATPDDATVQAVAEATATDAVVTGSVQEIEGNTGSITVVASSVQTEETTTEAQTEETTEAPTTEAALTEDTQQVASQAAASPVMDFTGKAVVTASGSVNIRKSGDVNAAKVGSIANGGLVNIVEKGDTWSHITSGNVDGYIRNDLLAFGSDAANYASANLSKVAVVNTAALKLRKEASTDSEEITILAQGETYPIVETGDAWTKIQLDTVTGYVKNEYITVSYNMATAKAESAPAQTTDTTTTTETTTTEAPSTEAPTTEAPVTDVPVSELGQQIANFACQFVGNPYVWGGTSLTNGADCSGFVQSVYKNFGYSLPRTCTPQSNAGTAVSLAALAPGDLVFYDHGTGSCEHVGIYIGNGQIVHASSSRTGIKISSVNYSTPFKACRIAN
ncbi:MAG: C40 family peptidase [Clostridium sp.]|nr:C40 family peptidase [Clostridium sp.]